MVPIADRDRMLLVGEKATELSAFELAPGDVASLARRVAARRGDVVRREGCARG